MTAAHAPAFLAPEDLDALRTGAAVGPAAIDGVVRLQGPDAPRWAQGMFTQDLRPLAPGAVTRAAATDDRGRILALLVVARRGPETLDLLLEGMSAEAFEARYGRYVLFDDLEVELPGDLADALRLVGPAAADVLDTAGLPTPESGHFTQEDGVTVLAAGREEGGFDLLVPAGAAAVLAERLEAAGARPDDGRLQEAARILAGRPRFPHDMRERAFVREMGLEEALCSFDKGCYVGQEVINRMRTRGRILRRLVGVSWRGSALEPGTRLAVGERTVGRLGTHLAWAGGRRGLAVVDLPHDAPGTELVAPDGQVLVTVPLPHGVPS